MSSGKTTRGKTILAITEDIQIRQLIEEVLVDAGYDLNVMALSPDSLRELVSGSSSAVLLDPTLLGSACSEALSRASEVCPRAIVIPPDTAERMRVDAMLRRYHLLSRYARDIILLMQTDGCIIEANDAAVAAYGYSQEELCSMSIRDLRDPETLPLVEEQMSEADKSGILFETRHRRKDGSVFPVEVSSRSAVADGEHILLSVIRDITERKRTEEALEESEARYRRLFEDSPVAILEEDWSGIKARIENLLVAGVKDLRSYLKDHPEVVAQCVEDIKITDVNSVTLDLYGAKSKQELRDNYSRVFTERTLRAFRDAIVAFAEGASVFETEHMRRTLIGKTKYVELKLSMVSGYRTATPKVIVSVADVTQRKRAEKLLRRQYQRERTIAETLQMSLMPQVSVETGQFRIHERYRAAFKEAEVGGDFYDVFQLDDGRVALVLGDISGKGLQAAVHTAMAKYMVRAYSHDNPEPEVVMRKLNQAMYHHMPEDAFVTVFYAVLDPDTRVLTYANGGHEPPLLHNRKQGRVVRLEVTGGAIGAVHDSDYSRRDLKMESGDVLLIYTDGITEARCRGRFFGTERVEETLAANADKDEQAIADAVLNDATDFAGGELRDDAAVLVIRVVEDGNA